MHYFNFETLINKKLLFIPGLYSQSQENPKTIVKKMSEVLNSLLKGENSKKFKNQKVAASKVMGDICKNNMTNILLRITIY